MLYPLSYEGTVGVASEDAGGRPPAKEMTLLLLPDFPCRLTRPGPTVQSSRAPQRETGRDPANGHDVIPKCDTVWSTRGSKGAWGRVTAPAR